jgi:hypothetical protein
MHTIHLSFADVQAGPSCEGQIGRYWFQDWKMIGMPNLEYDWILDDIG